ncbi:hypothetical protein MycrhDRAFT_5753 [Mycolicibacterium rhodesiae JS60]|nr:hypothetical protein MycrhDRAFT_5753 [Mycolicibacterium rhodesiae JS60]
MTAATADRYNPDNPRPWDPNHVSLRSSIAPHESGGVLRVPRTGRRGAALLKVFPSIPATRLMKQLQKDVDDEASAGRAHRPIHDALITLP